MKAYIIHENEDWMPPFRRAMEEANVPFEEWFVDETHFDLHEEPPPGIYLNRMSPSAHARGHQRSVALTHELLAWLESHGRRVINGSRAFAMEVSKARQYAALNAAGIGTPRTITVVGGRERLKEAARRMPTPFITKHNQGGSGHGIQLFHDYDQFDRYVDGPDYASPVCHVTLLQEYIEPAEPFITRVEFVDGEYLFAMRVRVNESFNHCPADPCAENGACPARQDHAERFELREDVDVDLIGRYVGFLEQHQIDIAGIEFIEDREGRKLTYDVNGATNYSEMFAYRHGVDGLAAVVQFLSRTLGHREDQAVARPA
jgi:glutathione synthase/RimK-type ligase-like ATP-grasp enzyme